MLRFKNALCAAIFLLIYCGALCTQSHAGELDCRSIDLSTDLSIVIKALKLENGCQDASLKRYFNPEDPKGIYWKFNGLSPTYNPVPVHVISDITYFDSEPVDRHRLDIYYPENAGANKVVFFVPGGAWRQGDKELYSALANTLAGYYSYTVVVINYRLSNDMDGNAVHPDHINDVARAFAWVKSHISPYGDADKIYLFGQSAGGHLVSLLATDPSYLSKVGCSLGDIRGVISMSGVYNLPDLVTYPNNPLSLSADEVLMYKKIMLDAFGAWTGDVLLDPSPSEHIHSEQPPFLVIYSYNDLPGFPEEAENFVRKVKQLDPAPEIYLRGIEFSDYSPEVWDAAAARASQEPSMSSYVGHYAEIVAINPSEAGNYVTRLVTDFIRTH